jgi:hypothetical protein
LNLYVSDIIEKVLLYYAILSAIQNHSSNRIEIRNRRRRRRKRYSNSKNHRITIFEIHSASTTCLVWCNHQTHFNRSLRTSFTRIYARIVVTSCLTSSSSRMIHNKKIRFLLIFWKIWFFESQMIQIACWRWFNKSETKSRKRIKNIMNNVI